jgi:nucleoside-diphosphate-sugar epimerase
MQTILGAGGAIGVDLARELKKYTDEIRLVSRNPKKINSTDQIFVADLINSDEVFKAVEGSEIVYLTVGLEYNIKVWKEKWPLLMKNVIDACIKHQSKLVFFDNVYMIGGDNVNHITEDSPLSPVSKKGQVRAQLNQMIFNQIAKGDLKAIIARSADFYGPVKDRSVMMELVYKNLNSGKKAQWLCNARVKHSFTYIPDAAAAIALLGNTEDAYNQIWNLPSDNNVLTGEEWIRLFADEMDKSIKYQVVPLWMLKILGIFIPVMREFPEMAYQFDRDYIFDSSKFEKRFKIKATSSEDGVRETVASFNFSA